MNNYHLFLIRSDSVTQIAAHLVAGIIALVFISTLVTAEPGPLAAEVTPVAQAAVMELPAGTPMLAASE